MEVLEQKIQDKIYELENSAEEKLEQNNLSAMMECMDKAWELYPEPKTNWTEAYNTAKHGFLLAKNIVKDFRLAKKWLDCMIKYNNINHAFDGDIEFNIGTYKFDTGKLEEAYKMFTECVRQSGKSHFRYFEDEDKKYLEFYKNRRTLGDKK
jgi:tetratricopeptide (TPR) repeat protein